MVVPSQHGSVGGRFTADPNGFAIPDEGSAWFAWFGPHVVKQLEPFAVRRPGRLNM